MKLKTLSLSVEKGFTMINLLIVAFVSSMIMIALINVSKQDVFDAQIDSSYVTVGILHKATKKYYNAHCNDASFVTPTPTILASAGLLNNASDSYLYDSTSPTISINNVGQDNVSFQYVYRFSEAYLAERAASTSSNASVNGKVVTWLYRNHSLENDSLVYNYEVLTAFGAKIC